ncbi:MAG: DinB family protein [Thermaurantimonas sp.]|uniref:DinB family protein n=1 Tax=Thermaurantimonas sp. TaxID=2681568 RepID=UPI0039196092
MHFKKPQPTDVPAFYQGYIASLPDGHVLNLMELGKKRMTDMLSSMDPEDFETTYQAGKWTLAQVIRHVIDAETVFLYRALTMSRRDSTELPSFDENHWADSTALNAQLLSPNALLRDYLLIRNLSINIFSRMTKEELFFRGRANNFDTCANDIAFIITGHEYHHLNIIGERYLKF